MKKVYEAPILETEVYELDASIASHCGVVVHNGPADETHDECDDYIDPYATGYSLKKVYNVGFYDTESCDCYTTGAHATYWTS